MFKKIYIVVSFLFCFNFMHAQASGLKVHVIDKKTDEYVRNATLILSKNRVEIARVYSDSNGYAKFQPIDTGVYSTMAITSSYWDYLIDGILVKSNQIVHVEIKLTLKSDSGVTKLNYGNVCTLGLPINKESSWQSGVFDSTDINRLPTKDIHYIQTFFPLH